MTYHEALDKGTELLSECGIEEAGTDAWLLLSFVCKIDRNFYYLHMAEVLSEENAIEYDNLIKKRTERIPLQYITGEQEFMGLNFAVNPNVLIPRQDTEVLVEKALKHIRPGMQVLDMCTGSGCIAVSVAHQQPEVKVHAADISKQALIVAKENARKNDVSVEFIQSDMFDHITEVYDVIVSNPPYIRTAEIGNLMPEVRDYEPVSALDGEEDGLHFYRILAKESRKHLHSGGYLIVEIGFDQGDEVAEIFRRCGFINIEVMQDLAGLDRVVIGKEREHV